MKHGSHGNRYYFLVFIYGIQYHCTAEPINVIWIWDLISHPIYYTHVSFDGQIFHAPDVLENSFASKLIVHEIKLKTEDVCIYLIYAILIH